MRKMVLMAIICQCIIASLSAQPTQQELRNNLQKYWYYRNRLKNFVVDTSAFNDAGTNIPASIINVKDDLLSFDEGNAMLNQYISVLATEYKLLKYYNQDYTKTIQQLYYAIMSFQRLDATAERWYGGRNTLNGFFLRNDPTAEFWNKYAKSGTNPFFVVNTLNEQLNNVTAPTADFVRSEDNVLHYIEAFALVNKLVDNETVDGNLINFKQLAQDNVRRIVGSLYHSSPYTKNYCLSGDLSNICLPVKYYWYATIPVTNTLVPKGDGTDGSMLLFSYGYAQAANNLLITSHFVSNGPLSDLAFPKALDVPLTGLQYTLTFKNYIISSVLGVVSGATGFSFDLTGPNNFDINLDLVDNRPPYSITIKTITSNTIVNQTFDYDDYKLRSLCATGNISSAKGLNPYQVLILKQKQNQTESPKRSYEHLPLLWSVLNSNYSYISSADQQFVLNLLKEAPSCGPNNYSAKDSSDWNIDWSSDNRLVWPENCGTLNNIGQFNGLDYMLLHNLYWLANLVAVKQNRTNPQTSVLNKNETFEATNDITISNSINLKSHTLQLYAGDMVTLQAGFGLSNAGNFYVDISEVTTTDEPVYYQKVALTNYNACPDRLH